MSKRMNHSCLSVAEPGSFFRLFTEGAPDGLRDVFHHRQPDDVEVDDGPADLSSRLAGHLLCGDSFQLTSRWFSKVCSVLHETPHEMFMRLMSGEQGEGTLQPEGAQPTGSDSTKPMNFFARGFL